MKNILAICAFIISVATTDGEILLNESFSYDDGILQDVSGGKWIGHSGTTNQVDVSSGAVNLTGSETQDVNAGLTNAPFAATGSAVLYAAFRINFSALPGKSGSYFAHFKSASASGFRARLWSIKTPDGKFNLGIGSASSTDPDALHPLALNLNTEYRVALKLEVANSVSTLWINPSAESDSGVQSGGGTGLSITSFALRQSSGMGTLRLDDLIVATSFQEAIGQVANKPVIVQQPGSTNIFVGDAASFGVQAIGPGPFTYQWFFNNIEISGETDSMLTLSNATATDAGFYAVRVSNNDGFAMSAAATLNVQVPSVSPGIIQQPVSRVVDSAATISFEVVASGTEPLMYRWLFNDVEIVNETGAALTLVNVTTAQSGSYKVVITNSAGFAVSQPATLLVREPVISPAFLEQPLSRTVAAGANVTFSFVASGSEPFTYQWLLNDLELAGETNSILIFPAVTLVNAGNYKVRVSNSKGPILSEGALLTVLIPSFAPTILQQPRGGTSEIGGSFSFTVIAAGTEPLTYQWIKDEHPLTGQTSATLLLQNLILADAGYYSVAIANDVNGISSESVQLQINPQPVIEPPGIAFVNHLSHLIRPGDLETNGFSEFALFAGETLQIEITVSDPGGRNVMLAVNTNELPFEAEWTAAEGLSTNVMASFHFTPTQASAGQLYTLRMSADNGSATNERSWSIYVPSVPEQKVVLTEFLMNPVSEPASPYFNPLHRSVPTLNPISDDQYIELVNFSTQAIDLSGWTLSDALELRHRFQTPSHLESSNALIVFAGPLHRLCTPAANDGYSGERKLLWLRFF